MTTLSLIVALAVTQTPPPFVEAQPGLEELAPARETNFSLTFSPLSTFLLSAALEGEFRIAKHFTGYLAGEFYGPWMGWGAQTGVRLYPDKAFKGFFIDAHARGQNLYVSHLLGGGLEIGSQHELGKSRWAILWSVGCDIGAGRFGTYIPPSNPIDWLEEGLTLSPKLRFMLGYHF
jgi:hypothetical protein